MTFARKIRVLVLALSAFAILAAVGAYPAAAAVQIGATDLNPGGAIVGASTEVEVFGIDLSGTCGLLGGDPCSLATITATFNQVGGDTDFDLLSDIGAGNAGIRVYKDTSKSGANNDVLNPGDNLVSDGWSSSGLTVTIDVDAGVPPAPEGAYTFFLTVVTSNTISNNDDFSLTLDEFDINPPTFPAPSFEGAESSVIKADTAPPVPLFSFIPTRPDDDVEWVFNEPVSGVDDENILLREVDSGDDVLGTVSYEANNRKAIFDPLGPLVEGIEYEAVVAPDGSPEITDAAGNVAQTFSRTFLILPTSFTPAIVNGNQWQLNRGFDNLADTSFAYGKASDVKVVGDWDGDGVFTPAVVRGNLWYFNNGFDAAADFSLAFGRSTDKKVVGDWDGDGISTPGIIRGNLWYLTNGFDPSGEIIVNYGKSTDRHVPGDWDGDGTSTPGIVRGNTWYLNNNFDATHDIPTFSMGRSSDLPLAADWDGDGMFTPAVFRAGQWFINNGFDSSAEMNFFYGSSVVTPLAGDWDGGAA
jgi:hypothetical protein